MDRQQPLPNRPPARQIVAPQGAERNFVRAVVAFGREMILERQREGIALAKGRGAYKGRKKALTPLS